MEFVSEVDRKFFSNNLNDDLELQTMKLDEVFEGSNSLMDLPEDLCAMDGELFPECYFNNDSVQHEFSDSSDSGVGCVLTQDDNWLSQDLQALKAQDLQVKVEPPSPSSTCNSDSSDTTFMSSGSLNHVSVEPIQLNVDADQVHNQVPLQVQLQQNIDPNCTTFINSLTPVCTRIGGPISISTIINSKVKIKPKPSGNLIVTSPVSKSTPNVFTQSENFSNMQSIIKYQKSLEPILQPGISADQVNVCTALNPTIQMDNELKASKRQQRMIKNRESASLSRKRKKEYLGRIEEQLQECTLQNKKLRQENELLKQRLKHFEEENENLKKSVSISPSKKVCLMAVFFIFGLNVMSGSFSILNDWKTFKPEDVLKSHKGRQLLSIPDYNELQFESFMPEKFPQKLKEFLKENPDAFFGNSSEPLICPSYFNKTESLRLAEQLSGWMQRVQLEKQKSTIKKNRKSPKVQRLKRFSQPSLRESMNKWPRADRDRGQFQVQLYDYMQKEEFWQAISRRNDTYYVLSFNTDYYLVPAAVHNRTIRPRMSLVMPAVALNESMRPPSSQVGMIQIDCEVLNTKLVNVHKSVLPRPVVQRNFTSYYVHDDDV